MPRHAIEVPHKLEYLQILSPDGAVDKDLEPDYSNDDLLRLYRAMLLSRRFDERMIRMQRQGRIGTYGPGLGQEASMMTAAFWLEPKDWLVPSFREGAAMFHRGWPVETIVLWWGGHEEGCVPPEGVNDLPIQVPVAAQTQTAAGLAYAIKYRGEDGVVACYCGDGGTSEGDFHEAINFASVLQLPVVFVIQNNQWAISLPRSKQTRAKTIAQKALAYGIDGIQVDGNDALAATLAGREAIEKARQGGGPTLIEAVTYRLGVHTTADDPKKYRKEEDVEPWKHKDPIPRFANYLKKKKVATQKSLDAMEEDVDAQIKEGIARAEAFGHSDPRDMFKYMYADAPANVREQLAAFEGHWKLDGQALAQ